MLTSKGMQGLVLANSAPTHVGVSIPLKRGRTLPLFVAGGYRSGEGDTGKTARK